MDSCTIDTPLGITKIIGDINGIASVSVLNEHKTASTIIPESLQDCVFQLHEYFHGNRKAFI